MGWEKNVNSRDVNKSINEMEMDAEEQQSFVISLLYFILLLFHQSVGIRAISRNGYLFVFN